ncbi:MAG: DUF3991 domain-containing protein [Burkholderiales bacterium]
MAVVHLSGYNFKEAIAVLAEVGGQPAAINQYVSEGEKHARRIIETTPTPNHKTDIPKAVPRNLPRVIKYLTEERSIDRAVVEKAVETGRLWADGFGNAVFSLKDPNLTGKQVGAELRGTITGKPYHGVRGEEKGFFFTGDAKSMVAVFVEAGIDALSYESLDRNALVVSTTGSRKDTLMLVAKRLADRGYKIASGFDLDQTGNRLTANLEEAIGEGKVERRKPNPEALKQYEAMSGKPGKDWNDALRGQRALDRQALSEQQQKSEKEVVVSREMAR